MTRTRRLFQLMQTMRRLTPPMTAQTLAYEMDVSLRTIYRDIDELRGLGAVIDGEAGFGFTLIEDATLPPLGFEGDELEALVLGLRNVAAIADPALAAAATSALSKIQARVPPKQAHRLQHAVLDARRYRPRAQPLIDVGALRRAAWDEVSVRFAYCDRLGAQTERMVKPLGIVFFDDANMLLAWCHLREDFRTFRLDRMDALEITDQSFRPHRVSLLRDHLALLRQKDADVAKIRAAAEAPLS